MTADLLIEILFDHPKANLAEEMGMSFSLGLLERLQKLGFASEDESKYREYTAPGRLGVMLSHIRHQNGAGVQLADRLPRIISDHLRWLTRPALIERVHQDWPHPFPAIKNLVILHGKSLVEGQVMGRRSGRVTCGHPRLGAPRLPLDNARSYEKILEKEGRVIPDERMRRYRMKTHVINAARDRNAILYEEFSLPGESMWEAYYDFDRHFRDKTLAFDDWDILDRAGTFSEWPTLQFGSFDQQFLSLPQEVVDTVLRRLDVVPARQRNKELLNGDYYYWLDSPLDDVTADNEAMHCRVANALVDAGGRVARDLATSFDAHLERLKQLPWEEGLGSQHDHARRTAAIASWIAHQLGLPGDRIEALVWQCKRDLATEAVAMYPSLHGSFGAHLPSAQGHPLSQADIRVIRGQHQPANAGEPVPRDPATAVVALADKLDRLVGLCALGFAPVDDTGRFKGEYGKDPRGVRLDALSIGRLLMINKLPLELPDLIERAKANLGLPGADTGAIHQLVLTFLERGIRHVGYQEKEVRAALRGRPSRLDGVLDKLPDRGEHILKDHVRTPWKPILHPMFS